MSNDFTSRRIALAILTACLIRALWAPAPLAAQAGSVRPAAGPERTAAERDDEDEYSDTGYIDSAVISRQIRVRFDSGLDGDRADRAEFFYGKCGCFTVLAGQRATGAPGPAVTLDFQEVWVDFEWAVEEWLGLFVEVPFRSLDVRLSPKEERSFSGLGDVRFGTKIRLREALDSLLTFQLRAYLATGDATEGLGTAHSSIEPGLLFLRRLTDRLTLASELRFWYPLSGSPDPVSLADAKPGTQVSFDPLVLEEGRIVVDLGRRIVDDEDATKVVTGRDPVTNDGFAGEVLRAGVGLSYDLPSAGRLRFTPVAELVGWHVLGGFQTVPASPAFEDASGDTIVNLKLGVRARPSGPGSFFLGAGFALTDDVWYQTIIRAEYSFTY